MPARSYRVAVDAFVIEDLDALALVNQLLDVVSDVMILLHAKLRVGLDHYPIPSLDSRKKTLPVAVGIGHVGLAGGVIIDEELQATLSEWPPFLS